MSASSVTERYSIAEHKPCKNCIQWTPLPEDPMIGTCALHNAHRFQLETCQQWVFGEKRPTRRVVRYEQAKYDALLDNDYDGNDD